MDTWKIALIVFVVFFFVFVIVPAIVLVSEAVIDRTREEHERERWKKILLAQGITIE